MRAFVTGGTGFVGSHLVEALLARGHEVACLARNPAKVAALFDRKKPEIVPGDLTDAEALRRGCARADLVYHVAGLTAARSSSELFAVNRDGTRRVLEAAAQAAPSLSRFVYVSSLSAAGPSRPGVPVTETDPPHPVSDYGRSKLAGEELVRAATLPWTIVRPPTVYGPRDVELLRMFKLAQWSILPVVGDRAQELSFVYAEDLAAALVAVTGAPAQGKTYFACHPEVCTAATTAFAIHRAVQQVSGARPRRASGPFLFPIPAPITRAALWIAGTTARVAGRATLLSPDKAAEFLAEGWTCSTAALERDTGWRATTDLRTGLEATARWYQTKGWI